MTDTFWQPIETAPKDGTLIFIKEKRGRIQVAAWGTPGYEELDWYVQLTSLTFDHYPTTDVTEWAPIPD